MSSANPEKEESPRVLVSCPYLEGSCLAITRELDRLGLLDRFVTTVAFPSTEAAARKVSSQQLGVISALVRRKQVSGISGSRFAHAGLLPELLHLALRRSRWTVALASQMMYRSKAHFDASTARLLQQRSLGSRPDVVLGVYGSAQCLFEQARRYRIPTVLHFVNSHPEVHNQLLSQFAHLPRGHHEIVPTWVERRVGYEIALADRILVPSEFVARQLRERKVQDARIVVLPYGVDVATFAPALDDGIDPVGNAGQLRAIFVGQISYRKGVPTLLEAARAAQTLLELRLIGPVTSPDLLKDLPPNVKYLGSLAHQEIPAWLARSDVLVLPSYEDAYPLVVLEAMGSGLPVIVSSNVGTAEFVEHGDTGYVIPPGQSSSLLEALRQLAADPLLRRRMGAAARAQVVRHATWQQYAAAAVQVITAAAIRS